jgi:FkbH-like protein
VSVIDYLVDILNNYNYEEGVSEELAILFAKTKLKQGELASALYVLKRHTANVQAVEQKTVIAELLNQLAKNIAKVKEVENALAQAEETYRRAAELDPAQASGYAQFLKQQKRPAEAIEQWQIVLKINPNDPNALLNLARLYEQTGEAGQSLIHYLRLIETNPSHFNYLTVSESLKKLADKITLSKTVKIALLGSSTLDHVQAYLRVECYRAGLAAELYQGGYDQYTQEILNPASGLYDFKPEIVILAVQPSRFFPNIASSTLGMSKEQIQAEIENGFLTVQNLLDTFTQRSSAMVLFHNMPLPDYPALGTYDWRDENGQIVTFYQINQRLAELIRSRYKNVYIVDEDKVQARTGKERVTDPRFLFHARMLYGEAVLPALTQEYLRYIKPYKAVGRKCIVLDLDNTLWGGVVGEDGMSGIKVGSEAPGNAFGAFQKELLKLSQRGILLAISSKNNPEDAEAVFNDHPDMVLRLNHFAARRINWQPKEQNIKELAKELNIGLDSLVFLDDNPVERAKVRAELPMVLVPEMPTDPAYYLRTLQALDVFDPLALTEEDRQRNQMYADQRARQDFEEELSTKQNSGSLEDYLQALEMVVEIDYCNDLSLPRIAQLTGKTNQFNTTTIRRSEAQISELLAKGYQVYTARVLDKFGDNGLTAVAIVAPTETRDGIMVREIDTFLMSCRVLGRGVETALLAFIAGEAQANGATRLDGWFIPTAKNAPAQDCYERHNFALADQKDQKEDGSKLWQFDLSAKQLDVPAWLSVKVPAQV